MYAVAAEVSQPLRREQGCPWDEKVCREAARGGYLETLMWLKEMGCPTTSSRITGRFELAKWKNDFLIAHPPI